MPNLSNTVTFLFAGDGSLASDGLSMFLQTKSNFIMVAECSDGATTIAEIAAHLPEIAVIDVQLPDMNASQVVEAVRSKNRETKLIILGGSADRFAADKFLAAGADAYVVRNGPSRHLNEAIRYVRDGGKYLAPQLTQEAPVAAEGHRCADQEAVSSLRKAVEAQAVTVERLEHAMDRAQYAIELLQQKVEQLTCAPIEQPTPAVAEETGRGRVMQGIRNNMGAVAAAMMVGIMGFFLAGVLRPAADSPFSELSNMGSEDSLKAGSTSSLNLATWESDTLEQASALLKNQQYSASENICHRLLKQNPANTLASRVLASALFHQNRVEESADVVRSIAIPGAIPSRREMQSQRSQQLTFDN
jgi:DNA-binding NarL/FixJ family response regulator